MGGVIGGKRGSVKGGGRVMMGRGGGLCWLKWEGYWWEKRRV